MEEISHSSFQPPCYSLKSVLLYMVQAENAEHSQARAMCSLPCYCGFFSVYKLFFTGRFIESGRQHSLDPLGQLSRNVGMKEMEQMILWLLSVLL